MIIKAQKEVFINTDLELSIFKAEIEKASENGTEITVFHSMNQIQSFLAKFSPIIDTISISQAVLCFHVMNLKLL